MKTINPYRKQKSLQLIFAVIGALGMVVGLYFFFGKNDHSFLISAAAYPFFILSGLIQNFQLRKRYIRFSNTEVEWNFITNENTKKIELIDGRTVIDSNWKGVLIETGEKEYEISLDGIWKKDRERIISEMKKFYTAA
ncbi:hypothetical protein OAD50_01135 [Vicingaceae bacterium]|nr:hypothetical protein [Vicingaceae bacterium]